jgi:hypothetical protein
MNTNVLTSSMPVLRSSGTVLCTTVGKISTEDAIDVSNGVW